MDLVTIFKAFNPADFHPFIADELSAFSMDGYSMAVGGIRVQVPENEAADAREFLEAK